MCKCHNLEKKKWYHSKEYISYELSINYLWKKGGFPLYCSIIKEVFTLLAAKKAFS